MTVSDPNTSTTRATGPGASAAATRGQAAAGPAPTGQAADAPAPSAGSGSPAGPADTGEITRLQKNLKPHWVWAIALGSAVGWGAFVLPTDWMAAAGPIGALLGLAIGGGLMILVGVSYGFLARTFPVSGGAFAYTLVGFGRTHAFICAWFMTLGYTSIVALNASALALLGRRVFPQVAELGYLYNVAGWDVYFGEVMIATVALVVFAFINISGASFSGRAQFIFCVIMVTAVVIVLIGVIVSPAGQLSNVDPVFHPDINPLAGIMAIVAIAPWAYIGFDNIPQAAEEFDFPAKKAFSLIVWSLLAATFLYCAMILATASAYPWQDLMGENHVWATADAIMASMGVFGLVLLIIAASMGIFTGLNGFFVSGSRVLLAMGRAEMIPAVFCRVHRKYGTPHIGIFFVMAFCLVAPWFGRTALSWIVDMASIGFTFAFLYTCACAFKLFRWSHQEDHADVEGARSTPRKLMAAAGVVVAIAFCLLLLVPGSPAQLTLPSMIAMGIWILVGVVFYFLRRGHNRTLSDDYVDQAVLGGKRPEFLRCPASTTTGTSTGTTTS
ncbi:APC family permease [Brevibacterium otitidis]|uniref:APC family permease n=1 Tax=Brevibacterium otitidis TaxID=53364 RepID=A0ABV5X1J0_9MICO|nr:APC family permease [Brevibacterium otitidis]BFF08616.1 APC family permease [Brevibacterium otitidis]